MLAVVGVGVGAGAEVEAEGREALVVEAGEGEGEGEMGVREGVAVKLAEVVTAAEDAIGLEGEAAGLEEEEEEEAGDWALEGGGREAEAALAVAGAGAVEELEADIGPSNLVGVLVFETVAVAVGLGGLPLAARLC